MEFVNLWDASKPFWHVVGLAIHFVDSLNRIASQVALARMTMDKPYPLLLRLQGSPQSLL
jgi:hypothetical protein